MCNFPILSAQGLQTGAGTAKDKWKWDPILSEEVRETSAHGSCK